MDKLERAYQLDKLFKQRRTSVSMQELCARFECSESTVKRTLAEMRDILGAPILNEPGQGYRYSRDSTFEMPGVWFNGEELHALLTMQQLAAGLSGGYLESELTALRLRIEHILHKSAPLAAEEMKRIRVLDAGRRSRALPLFPMLATALLQRKRLQLDYQGRGRGAMTRREVSPQRLAHYRGNWYLDVWCHLANDFRSLAVERISEAKLIERTGKHISETELDNHFASSFGIFGGLPTAEAVLRFTPQAAAWVADEQWFPDLEGIWLEDGRFELRIPYNNPTELIMEICRHGPEVEVVAPVELRRQVAERLQQAAGQYARKVTI